MELQPKSERQTELGEADWMRIAETAYNAYRDQIQVAHPRQVIAWNYVSTAVKRGWVASVKATAEQFEALVK